LALHAALQITLPTVPVTVDLVTSIAIILRANMS
jgi:hypothetical protein